MASALISTLSQRLGTGTTRPARIMGGALIGMGILHLAVPAPFDAQIPAEIPGDPRALTYASGVAEAAIGAGLLVPATRRASALSAVALFVAVYPANINMCRLYWHQPVLRAITLLRLPLQIPMITTALRIYRNA
ncbi:hypothetical protein [Williamsia sp. CHRR-6]|uniref:DoxX family protein n=1 Tax=Williamsia sp. CHRR-6 TaxID=2835871 RepID=UPI001BD9C595|nr:hypothetical protein [Williamsia sp. CHRR-6]MBT0565636.1 hypothetical protein [Williamsia sp. CHRR-6]